MPLTIAIINRCLRKSTAALLERIRYWTRIPNFSTFWNFPQAFGKLLFRRDAPTFALSEKLFSGRRKVIFPEECKVLQGPNDFCKDTEKLIVTLLKSSKGSIVRAKLMRERLWCWGRLRPEIPCVPDVPFSLFVPERSAFPFFGFAC